jgi:carboxymethylenebutenolidase
MRSLLLCPFVVLAGCGPGQPAPRGGTETTATFSVVIEETPCGWLYRPAAKGPSPAIVVVHGDFGLTEWVKESARRLATAGYVTLAVDLYHGQVVTDVMDAHIMDRGLSEDRVRADLRAAADYLTGRADVRKAALGILGWDTGGGYALDAAVGDPRLRAVVTCCGRLTTDPALLAPLHASVFGLFAGKDEGITPETIAQFRAAMAKAGKRLAGIHVYPECEHGFMDSSAPQATGAKMDPARADAWKKIQDYLATELK